MPPLPIYSDSHAHLNSHEFDSSLEQVLSDAAAAGVGTIVDVGTDAETSARSLELASRYDNLYATVGVHPHEAKRYSSGDLATLLALHDRPRVVAIGEIGLDYFYDHSPRDKQRDVYSQQLEFALRHGRPVIIHARDAVEEALSILEKDFREFPAGVFHCYAGDYRQAVRILDRGMYLSFGGAVTFKKADPLRELVARLPLRQMLLETDCPWLTPEPHRKVRPNAPRFLPIIAAEVAKALSVDAETVGKVTTENLVRLFRLGQAAGAK